MDTSKLIEYLRERVDKLGRELETSSTPSQYAYTSGCKHELDMLIDFIIATQQATAEEIENTNSKED